MTKKMKNKNFRVLNAIKSENWLITDEWYQRIVEIASRENTLTPEMISAYQSSPNGREKMVTMYGDTAVMDINGPVFRYANLLTMFSGATSTEIVSSEMARLENDEKVKRIIVRYDTPGGVASGAAEMSTQIRNSSKPVTSFATGLCASLGYFWASQGDDFVVEEDSIVGNIGTRTQAPDPVSENDMVSRNAPKKILDRSSVMDVINGLEDVFVAHVAMGRGVSEQHVRENFGQGGVFVGLKAVEAGLADSVGTLDSILGGDFPSKPPARKSVISKPSKKVNSMKQEGENAGGITAAQNKLDVDKARAEGREAGIAEANANAATAQQEAVSAENGRCIAIFEASVGKPSASVTPIMKNTAITAEQAVEIVNGFPSVGKTNENDYSKNPKITNDSGGNDDGEITQAAIENSWAKATGRA